MSAPKLLDRLRAKQAELLEMERRSRSTPVTTETDRQAERIRRLAADISAEELLAARKRIKPALQKSLSAIDLNELALTLAHADKREKLTATAS